MLTSISLDTYLVDDAGYQPLTSVLMPYPIPPVMEVHDRWYNLVHIRTRIVVEKAFGRLKGKFRVFKTDLSQETLTAVTSVVKSCLVLHSWFIDLDATSALEDVAIADWLGIDQVWWAADEDRHQASVKQERARIRECLLVAREHRMFGPCRFLQESDGSSVNLARALNTRLQHLGRWLLVCNDGSHLLLYMCHF